MSVLKPEFLERHVSSIPHIPSEWMVGAGFYYQLHLKMCQISQLKYAFKWAQKTRDSGSIIENPNKILQLDVSLNDLVSLDHSELSPFSQLRVLNASLNRLQRYVGVECLRHLRILDLSHNNISAVDALQNCKSLTVLNLGMNQLESISDLPPLGQLRELHLNNNKLKSLDGVQALPALRELHVQRNFLTDVIPLASNFRLCILNAADNHIKSFSTTLEILHGLKRLQALTLHGNPIDHEVHYQARLLEVTDITLLDNINIRPHPKHKDTYSHHLGSIKDTTRHAFLEHIAEKRQVMEENVRFLQKRILSIQDDFRDYEVKAHADLEACLRHMETLSLDEAQKYYSDFLHSRLPGPVGLPQHTINLDRPPPRPQPTGHHMPSTSEEAYPRPGGIISPTGYTHHKGDYTEVKNTDEVLRCVYNELNREQDRSGSNVPEW